MPSICYLRGSQHHYMGSHIHCRKPPTMVESLSIPAQVSSKSCLFNPTLYYIASTDSSLCVWDIHNSRFLIESSPGHQVAFSPDGCFFASRVDSHLSIWKKSSTGYTLIQKIPIKGYSELTGSLRFSPDGRFILVQCEEDSFQLWPTGVSAIPPSNLSAKTPYQETENFILEFSPANTLAIVTRAEHKVVIVLDLRDGLPQLTIDVSARVNAIQVIGSTAFVLSAGNVFAWGIPTKCSGFDHNARISNTISAVRLKGLNALEFLEQSMRSASISPNSHYIAGTVYEWKRQDRSSIASPKHKWRKQDRSNIASPIHKWKQREGSDSLCVYDATTGNYLNLNEMKVRATWFTPDSSELCVISHSGDLDRWRIAKNGKLHVTKLEDQELAEDLPGGLPWLSTNGYKITNDCWILSPNGKYLLWLPHRWQSSDTVFTRKWSEHYLALLHSSLACNPGPMSRGIT